MFFEFDIIIVKSINLKTLTRINNLQLTSKNKTIDIFCASKLQTSMHRASYC